MAIVFIQTIEFIQPTLMMDFLNTSVNNVVDGYHVPTAWIDNIRGVLCIITTCLNRHPIQHIIQNKILAS